MNYLIIGSGLMGSALAFDLSRSDGVSGITLADIDIDRAERVAASIGSPLVKPKRVDVNDYDAIIELMNGHVCSIGAVSYRFNYALSKAAIEAGSHYLDLGGNDEVVARQMTLHDLALRNDVLIVPNCGLAPGMANVIAARAAEKFESVENMRIRVGGLPRYPKPPLNYQLVFSVEGLINEYSGKSVTLRQGRITEIETMTEIESIEFPPPFDKLEAFHTSGGASTLPAMFEGKVTNLDYKTIRYPGHCERFKTLLDLGFGSAEPITVGSNVMTAKELFYEMLKKRLSGDSPDVVLVRVELEGTKNGTRKTLRYELIDSYDTNTNITAMMRTTSYPTSVIAQLIAHGSIVERGVLPPEQCVPLDPFLAELRKRDINIKEQWL
ncbi:MAG TPA: saccharopine dehydrogenase C-terminal domain-containing protein [Bacteroidota bacterium]|nr:saccharopine dehydrogenase C-terminal domain-containing protein [Bacteroidota bacterium]